MNDLKNDIKPVALGMGNVIRSYHQLEGDESVEKVSRTLNKAIEKFKNTSIIDDVDLLESARIALGKDDTGDSLILLLDGIEQIIDQLPGD